MLIPNHDKLLTDPYERRWNNSTCGEITEENACEMCGLEKDVCVHCNCCEHCLTEPVDPDEARVDAEED